MRSLAISFSPPNTNIPFLLFRSASHPHSARSDPHSSDLWVRRRAPQEIWERLKTKCVSKDGEERVYKKEGKSHLPLPSWAFFPSMCRSISRNLWKNDDREGEDGRRKSKRRSHTAYKGTERLTSRKPLIFYFTNIIFCKSHMARN